MEDPIRSHGSQIDGWSVGMIGPLPFRYTGSRRVRCAVGTRVRMGYLYHSPVAVGCAVLLDGLLGKVHLGPESGTQSLLPIPP